jgi:hypothetical protein
MGQFSEFVITVSVVVKKQFIDAKALLYINAIDGMKNISCFI